MIFILNKQEKVVNILRNGGGSNEAPPFFDDIYSQDLATGAETFSFSTVAINNVARDLVVGNYVAFKNDEGEYKLFQITQTEEYHEDAMYMNVYAEGAGLELINKVFRARKSPSTNLRKFMEMVLDETGWNVGVIPFSAQESIDLDLPDATVYSTLQSTLSKYGVEMAFRCEINNGRISSKFVDLYTQRGRVTGKRFSFGRDIEGIKRKVDSTELFTALIGKGNKDINFKDVTVDGINKPLGQDFVADQDAYDRYNNNGYHIIGIFNYDTDSPEELLRETYKQLQKCKEPKIEYEVSVALLGELLGESWNKVSIGDTVAIVDNAFNPPIHLMARVSKLDKSKTNKQSSTCTLANFVEVQSNITDEMRKIASQLEGYVEGALDNKFPIGSDDIQEGAVNGSHIYQNTISTDHLIADAVTANKIKAESIESKHIKADSILSEHIAAEQIEAEHIKSGTITADKIEVGTITAESGIIADATIGTAQIKDAEITVAKIQDAFVDSLVANQGKFQSAHIGVLTSDNIDADTIKAEHIQASVIDAINLNVEGKISADRIDVNSIKVEDIDAGKITTGTLDADRITSSVITAINASIENATIDSAKIGELDASKIATGSLSADLIKTNVISAINASIGKISADRIDVDSIKVGNIDAGQITTGDLSADRIQSTVISAINSYSGTAKIKQAQIETLQVGNANITDLDASKIKTGKISAERIDADNLVVKSANITGEISASKISGGTLDASKMTVTNLKADSITAGSITVEGNNLIHGTDFEDLTKWDLGVWKVDNNVTLDGVKSVKIDVNETSTKSHYLSSTDIINTSEGESFVGSCYIRTPNKDTISGNGLWVEFTCWKADNSVTYSYKYFKPTSNNTWERIIYSAKIPSGVVRMRADFGFNGTVCNAYIAKPMLSRGTIASIWKLHTDELISDGAIDTDKIADEAINSDKLNVNELFVGDNAFIKSLKAVEIDASNITTGTISGERIDIKGLISFESFDEDLQRLFDVTGNKTYINGGMIATNTIKASSIDLLSGLTVRGEDNTTTFSIASNGEVEVNGLLKSGNFDEDKNTGYQLSTDGKAILNQAIVRGDVILPSAGMTNYGGQIGNKNLLKNSDFSMNHSWSGGSYVDGGYEGDRAIQLVRTNWTSGNSRLQSSQALTLSGFSAGDKLTLSCWVYVDKSVALASNSNDIALRAYKTDGNFVDICVSSYDSGVKTNEWIYLTATGTLPTGFDASKTHTVLLSINQNGKVKYSRIKLEKSNKATPWCPYDNEQLNHVRIWAGAGYDGRTSARFRVYDNGDVYASNGTFSGLMKGTLDSGDVQIYNNAITVHSPNTETEVIKFNANTSMINTDLILGSESDKKITFSNGNREISFNNMNMRVTGAMTDMFIDKTSGAFGGLNLISKVSSGHHVLRHSSSSDKQGTMVFDSEGSQGQRGDFSFTRKNYGEDVKVDIDGNLFVKNSISSSQQNIEMRSVSNEGWGFYAT